MTESQKDYYSRIALEQRCERDTPWDVACTAIAEAIRNRADWKPSVEELAKAMYVVPHPYPEQANKNWNSPQWDFCDEYRKWANLALNAMATIGQEGK